MSDEILNGAAAPADAAAAGPAFTIEKIYVKDVSFESPNAPAVFNDANQPELQLNLNQKVQRLNDNAFEVVLAVTLTCTAGGKTA
ncbi:protein-export chaperone SecB, partial [Xanthomonas oryzae]